MFLEIFSVDIMKEKLIVAVQKLPCLYNSQLYSYRNKNIWTNAWTQVAQDCGLLPREGKCKVSSQTLIDQSCPWVPILSSLTVTIFVLATSSLTCLSILKVFLELITVSLIYPDVLFYLFFFKL